jgi:hypothetical protein
VKRGEQRGTDATVQVGVCGSFGEAVGKRGAQGEDDELTGEAALFAGGLAVEIVGKVAGAVGLEGEFFDWMESARWASSISVQRSTRRRRWFNFTASGSAITRPSASSVRSRRRASRWPEKMLRATGSRS